MRTARQPLFHDSNMSTTQPFSFVDYRLATHGNPSLANFKQKVTEESINGRHILSEREEHTRSTLPKLRADEFCQRKQFQTVHKAHEGEDVLIVCNHNLQVLPEDAVALVGLLKACAKQKDLCKGSRIHADVCRRGLLRTNIYVGSALISMYAKCGALEKAEEVFEELPVPNRVAWNALIAGYAQHGHGHEALDRFEQMQHQGWSPDAVTLTCILKACGNIGAVAKGEEIHAEVVRQGLLETDAILGTALVDMYARCGASAKAEEVFDELPARDVVCWSALIAGYAQHGHCSKALSCFDRMQLEGFSPDSVTFTSILKACGSVGAAEKGEEIHAEVVRRGLLEKDSIVGNTLVDMYAKCGRLAKAQRVFDAHPVRDVVCWSALIAGYAQVGKVETAFDSFNKMIGEGVEPDLVSFVVLLNACSHSGLVEEGQMYFVIMTKGYGIIPTLEHHTCMVDLFGRAGHFDKAIELIEKMSPSRSSDHLVLWSAVLGACRKWGNVKVGRLAFENVVKLDAKDASAYVCMSNIYAAARMRVEADKVEALRVKNKAWKLPGCCWWTDERGNVHSFSIGDTSHPQSKCIYEKLKVISQNMSREGYFLSLQWESQGISDDAKMDAVCGHSEQLAIACALINTPKGTPIRVTKNTRVCGDCHYAMSLISKMENRSIVVRDANYFHIFEDGKCGCTEYG